MVVWYNQCRKEHSYSRKIAELEAQLSRATSSAAHLKHAKEEVAKPLHLELLNRSLELAGQHIITGYWTKIGVGWPKEHEFVEY